MQGARCLRSPSGVGDASVISGELFHMAFLGPAVRSWGLLATAAPSLFSRPAYRLCMRVPAWRFRHSAMEEKFLVCVRRATRAALL